MRLRRYVTLAAVSALAGGMLGLGLPGPIPSAEAVPGCFANSNGVDYGSMSVEEQIGSPPSPQATLNGIRSDLYVSSVAVSCQRIQSVYVRNATYNRLMEFGWAKGKFACYNDQTFVDFAQETPFAVAFEPNARYCHEYTGLTFGGAEDDTYHEFRASDANENGYWGPWLDGSQLSQAWQLTFTQGLGGVNAERANASDPMQGNFRNIEEVHSGTWSPTDQIGDPYDTDPGYKWDLIAGDHAKIVAN